MNKRSARGIVFAERPTFGYLQNMIGICLKDDPDGRANVNQSMTHHQALRILAMSIAKREPQAAVDIESVHDVLIATNVLRECL